jgi:hypothetical protein
VVRHAFRLLLLGSLLILLAGCGAGRQLVKLEAGRDTVQADGRGAPATLRYALDQPATVDLYAVAPSGERWYLRRAEPRAAGNDYQYLFDGTYPLPDRPVERRVLPDGAYRLVLEAEAAGRRQSAEAQVEVRDADTEPPSISNLTAFPEAVSPNFDGLDDAAAITYRLDQRARVALFATDAQGKLAYTGPQAPREPGEYRQLWPALDNKQQPLPDGAYQFTVQATDPAGNVSQASVPVHVAAGGRPEARLLDVQFTPRQVASGGILTVRFRVRNTGETTLRSQGPDPGFLYSSYDTYANVLNRQFVDRAGVWRVGVDWAGSPSGSLAKYPYRWGLGQDLAPGQEAEVEGQIRLEHGPLQDRGAGLPSNRVFFYAGLIQENMAFFDDQVGGTWIELGY